ncbi:D-aminoacid aminotransferase-like PLP-dependent enzyme [Sistotremastrum niveocremeum HHB9708]|uniref:D-aminoacid aminotransferase-like PLP-dependent enzyme n=1 Tax=Sistotremastrum niveocremeum HHB9708 TaxID=1314777 RepID=A0A164UK59_9AGAM|nr:D-aminoacid aminotransferase-like PLP-dependent enzyme [Sistotremastrum niveocremeum HHB9708]
MSNDFQLFTSLRYDPALILTSWNNRSPLMLLDFHLDRLRQAARTFQWPNAIKTMDDEKAREKLRAICKKAVQSFTGEEQCLRIRILLSEAGELSSEAYPATWFPYDLLHYATFNPDEPGSPIPEPSLALYLDTEATPSSLFTSTKTTSRAHYDNARNRVGIKDRSEPKEVILFNERGEVTEGSVRNVAFWRDGIWITPGVDSGCLPGTVRRWMLERGKMKEGLVKKDTLKNGEWVLLSNGVDGVQLGKIVNLA